MLLFQLQRLCSDKLGSWLWMMKDLQAGGYALFQSFVPSLRETEENSE